MTRATLVPMLFVTLLTASPLEAQSDAEIVGYLSRNFGGKVWPHVQDLIGNHVIHGVSKQLLDEPQDLTLDRSRTSFDLSAAPGFRMRGRDLVIRFPATGSHTVDGTIDYDTHSIFGTLSVDLHIDISFEALVSANRTEIQSLDIDIDLTGFTGFIAELLPRMRNVENTARRTVEANLGFIKEFIFDTAAPLQFDSPRRELIRGDSRIDSRDAVDLFLVADGYSSTNLSNFEVLAEQIANKVLTGHLVPGGTPTRASRPFSSFDTAIRIWTIKALDTTSTDGERVIGSFSDPVSKTTKTSMKNLARLARIGLFAEQNGFDADVLIFVLEESRTGGARASAFGNLVLLPEDPPPMPSSSVSTAASPTPTVLIHELGHTILGNLADEYVEASRQSERYMGLDPANPNVGVSPLGWVKWRWWMQNPGAWESWDDPILRRSPVPSAVTNEGAYYFGSGALRPRRTCKMFEAGGNLPDVPFCQVCREALTRGIRKILARNMALVDVEHLAPWRESSSISVATDANSARDAIMAYSGNRKTEVRLSLAASSLPRPLDVEWQYISPVSGLTVSRTLTGESVDLEVELGGRIHLTIHSRCRFVPRDRIDDFQVTLDVSIPVAPGANPLPPHDLVQTPAVGARIPVTYDPGSGSVQFDLSMNARTGGFALWDLDTAVEFDLRGPENRTLVTIPRPRGTPFSFTPVVLRRGFYSWRVRTIHRNPGLVSTWEQLPDSPFRNSGANRYHFEVLPPSFDPRPRAPHAPVDLGASGPPSLGSRRLRTIELLAASWDLNGENVKLQFEVKRRGQRFNSVWTAETGFLSPTLESLRVDGSVVVGPLLDPHVWQVRAVDSTGRESPWVYGGLISSSANPPVSVRPRDPRLDLIKDPIETWGEKPPTGPDDPIFGG